jgi:hypothetical protein
MLIAFAAAEVRKSKPMRRTGKRWRGFLSTEIMSWQRQSYGLDSGRHLARAWALAPSGDKSRVDSAYQGILALWRNADPDTPEVRQVRAEYARLS